MNNFYKCDCVCHNGRFGAKHIVACCSKCKYCQQRIKNFNQDMHEKECKEKHIEMLEKYGLKKEDFKEEYFEEDKEDTEEK